MRFPFRMAILGSGLLLVVLGGCDVPRGVEKEPDPEPKEPGPLVFRKRIICKGHEKYVTSVAVSPDGKLVASASDDGTLRFWNAADGKPIRIVRPEQPSEGFRNVNSLSFSPDGKTLVAGITRSRLAFYDSATGKPSRGMPLLRDEPGGTAFSPDGKALAVASHYGVRVWSLVGGDKLFDFASTRPFRRGVASGGGAATVRFSPNGRYVAAGLRVVGGSFNTEGPMLRVWELATGKEVFSAREALGHIEAMAFSPDGKLLAADAGQMLPADVIQVRPPDVSGTVEVYDWVKKRRVSRFRANKTGTFSMVFSPDGSLYTGSHDGVVRRWVPATGKAAGSLIGHSDLIHSLAISKNGKVLVSGASDFQVIIWHLGSR